MIEIFCDGASRGNPAGLSSVGFLILDNKKLITQKGRKINGIKTNNFAEYEAVIQALRLLTSIYPPKELKGKKVTVFTDSKLVVKQVTNKWTVIAKSLKPQNFKVKDLSRKFKSFRIKLIPRELNKKADKLAKGAFDE